MTTTTETDDVMLSSSPLAPAYLATITPLPLHHPTLNRIRLSGRQANALTGLTAVPVTIDGTSTIVCARAECQENARYWVQGTTGEIATYYADADRGVRR